MSEVEVITAKWTTSRSSTEEYFGTIEIDDELVLKFPILKSFEDIPYRTNVFWGKSEKLQKCTAVTLPVGPCGTASTNSERSFSNQGLVQYLMVGDRYIDEPLKDFVTEINFVPKPNDCLRVLQIHEFFEPRKDISEIKFSSTNSSKLRTFASAGIAYFEPERPALFEVTVESIPATISAWISGKYSLFSPAKSQSYVNFHIRFDASKSVRVATDEALKLCTFLSLLSHQYIYPDEFFIRESRDATPLRLMLQGVGKAPRLENGWVRNTILLPDEDSDRFCSALQKWYATNGDCLRSRFLYRHSLRRPNTYTSERYLAAFQALEGLLAFSKYHLLSNDELDVAAKALFAALPSSPKLGELLHKLRGSNSASLRYVLRQELPKLFSATRVVPDFGVEQLVDRIYMRRNRASHGGSHLGSESLEDLMTDTILVTAISLLIETLKLGLDAHDAFAKFKAAHLFSDLPLKVIQ